ncbi:hypothetical protein DE146DRAFT_185267 [Phaeosphaeria sp. MPI-PUGE-AT-0046c]|nr:hypothetical protein DE146DRAFT_185267 [Phaeosphaeria sp. MPI-PUGE-AT-0046c]
MSESCHQGYDIQKVMSSLESNCSLSLYWNRLADGVVLDPINVRLKQHHDSPTGYRDVPYNWPSSHGVLHEHLVGPTIPANLHSRKCVTFCDILQSHLILLWIRDKSWSTSNNEHVARRLEQSACERRSAVRVSKTDRFRQQCIQRGIFACNVGLNMTSDIRFEYHISVSACFLEQTLQRQTLAASFGPCRGHYSLRPCRPKCSKAARG